jgi:hypothetical protein
VVVAAVLVGRVGVAPDDLVQRACGRAIDWGAGGATTAASGDIRLIAPAYERCVTPT